MHRIFILFLFIFLISCSEKERFDTMSDKEIVDLLFDINLANAIAENAPEVKRDSLRDHYLNQIATIHKTERSMIDSIIDYVHLDNERFRSISDSLDSKLKHSLDTIK